MTLRGGRYEILGTIAAGGMATVQLGRALGAGGFERLVAVKTMHPHLARQPEFVAMFLDEARLAARIRHPNVVATLDIQQDAEGLFLVMELVEGASLSRLQRALALPRGSSGERPSTPDPAIAPERLPLDAALRIFTDTLAGLHAAHELTGPDGEPLHLIHRDMSPHNILVGSDGIARITDFGVARAESRIAITRTGSVKGKVTYMAPEQVRSDPLDRRADIYAAGVVLWEMLTGQRSLRAENELAAMRMIVESDRQPPHEVEPSVPVPLSTACMRALARDPEQRYPTAAAFSEAIEGAAAASGTAIAAPRAVAQLLRALGVHKLSVTPLDPAPASSSHATAASGGLSRAAEGSLSDAALDSSSRGVSDGLSRAASGNLSRAADGDLSRAADGSLSRAAEDGHGSEDTASAQGASMASSGVTRADVTPASIGTHAAFAAHAPEAAPERRSRKGMFFLLGSAAVLGAAVAFFVVGRPPAGDAPSPAAAPQLPASATPSQPSTDTRSEDRSRAAAPPTVVPVEPAPPLPSTATAATAATAAVRGTASTSASAPAATRPAAPRATATPTSTSTAAAGPKSFRPKEL